MKYRWTALGIWPWKIRLNSWCSEALVVVSPAFAKSMKASIESVWDPLPFRLKARRMDLLMLPGSLEY